MILPDHGTPSPLRTGPAGRPRAGGPRPPGPPDPRTAGSPASGSSTVTRRKSPATSGDAEAMASWRSSWCTSALNASRCSGSTKSTALQAVGHLFGTMHRQFQRLEPGAGPASRGRRDVATASSHSLAVRRRDPCTLPRIVRADPAVRRIVNGSRPRGVRLGRWMGAQMLEPLPQAGGIESATVRELHDVLVTDKIVGMLGHRAQGGLGGPGPALGRGQVARPRMRSTRNCRNGRASATARARAAGSLRARSPGSLPLGRSATTTSTSCLRSHS